jgi:hypothetical protein
MPTPRPLEFTTDTEFTTIEFFLACDPENGLEAEEPEELLAMFAGSMLGVAGFELLHHCIEGIEHAAEIGDALRPQVQPQQILDAARAFRQNPRPFAPGEVKGLWIQLQVPRQVLREVIRHTAPSARVVAAPVQNAPAPRRPFLPPRLRPAAPRPSWA